VTDSQAINRVISGLGIDRLDQDLFLGNPGEGTGRLFGGMVAAQSTMAAQLTVDEGTLHSLHAYFLRGGSYDQPLRFVVHRIRDGRTYTTRRVVAHQNGEAIFNLAASFTRPEEGGAHQQAMPNVPGPEELPLWEEVRATPDMPAFRAEHLDAFEVRLPWEGEVDGQRFVWMKPRGVIPHDPHIDTAITVYASDRSLVSSAVAPMGYDRKDITAASLDHALWLHRPARFDDWILYTSNSPAGFAGRGVAFGSMYTRDGVLFASVAQEGLIRLRSNKAG